MRTIFLNLYANVQRVKRDIFTAVIHYYITTEFHYAKRDSRFAAYGGLVWGKTQPTSKLTFECERRRAKPSGGKESGEEVPRKWMLLWKRVTRNLSCQSSYFRWKLIDFLSLLAASPLHFARNLVPRVPGISSYRAQASEMRPWHTLVTCHFDNRKHQGGVLCNQAIGRVELCRIQSLQSIADRHYPRCLTVLRILSIPTFISRLSKCPLNALDQIDAKNITVFLEKRIAFWIWRVFPIKIQFISRFYV